MAGKQIQMFAGIVDLQVAAESFLKNVKGSDDVLGALVIGNRNNSVEPKAVAAQFAGAEQRYKLVAHQELTLNANQKVPGITNKSGLSASLFFDTQTNQYTLSIRSTEVPANIRDPGDLFADVGIGVAGWAFGQIASLESLWQYLTTGAAAVAVGGLTVPSTSDLEAFRLAILGGSKINVTGFSLGGNIAEAFVELHDTQVSQAYLFNSAGTGIARVQGGLGELLTRYQGVFNNPASEYPPGTLITNPTLAGAFAANMLAKYRANPNATYESLYDDPRHWLAEYALRDMVQSALDASSKFAGPSSAPRTPNSKIWDIWASNYLGDSGIDTIVSRSGQRHGTSRPIWYEDQSFVEAESLKVWDWGTGHSVVLLQDSLHLMAAFEKLDNTVTEDFLARLFQSASDISFNTLERTLDSLSKLFGVDESIPEGSKALDFANIGFRNAFYERLSLIQGLPDYQALQGKVRIELLGTKTASDIAKAAMTDFGAMASLLTMSPFRLVATDQASRATLDSHWSNTFGIEYQQWAADFQNPGASQKTFSRTWLEDRAGLLQAVLATNIVDKRDPVRVAGPTDVSIEYQYFADGVEQVFIADPIGGKGLLPKRIVAFADDAGRSLVGTDNAAGDHLYGGSGADTLTGNKGADYLEGGAGADQYVFAAGDGFDTIFDTDGQGSIQYDGITLTGGKQLDQGDGIWRAEDGQFVYAVATNSIGSNTLTITGPNDSRIEVKNFHSGDLGITLDNALPVFPDASGTREIHGDWGWKFFPSTNEELPPGYRWFASVSGLLQIDDLGNFVRDGAAPLFNIANTPMFGSEGADTIVAGPALMSVYGKGGDDHLLGTETWDNLFGGAGDDFIEGGLAHQPDQQYPDLVYPDNETISGGEYDDFLNGGTGNDTIFGETAADLAHLLNPETLPLDGSLSKGDVILAGEGDDWVYGSRGDDALFGGAGKDVIVGGAGDDFLDGDDNFRFNHPTYAGARQFKIEPGSSPFEVRLYPVTLAVDANPSVIGYDIAPTFEYYRVGGDADTLDGGAGNDTLYGMSGADVLIGGDGDDVMAGWESDDVLEGGDGNDLMAGDFGRYEQPNQRYVGVELHGTAGATFEPNHDPIDQRGKDFLDGGAGNDVMYGEADDDVLIGGAGDDQMWGDAPWLPDSLAGNDEMHGGEGDDFADGGAGDDQIYGDDGADDLRGGSGNDLLDGGDGDDVLDGGDGDDVVIGGEGSDRLFGGAGDDYLEGGFGDDVLVGGDGADVLVGGAGLDVLRGGAGDDTYIFDLGDGREVIDDDQGVNRIVLGAGIYASDVTATLLGSTLVVDIGTEGDGLLLSLDQKVSGYELADGSTLSQESVLSGATTTTLHLRGTQGQALTIGTSGADTLSASEFGEELYGGAGSDTYYFGRNSSSAVVLEEGGRFADVDRIVVGSDLDSSDLTLQRLGTDLVLSIGGSFTTLTVRDQFSGDAKIESLEFGDGTAWDAAAIRDRVRNVIAGTAGDDRLEAISGSDLLEGGDGADVYVVDPVAPGIDLVRDTGGLDQDAYASWYYASIGTEDIDERRAFAGKWAVFGSTASSLSRQLDGGGRSLSPDQFRETSDSPSFAYASLDDLEADLADSGISYNAGDVAFIEPLPEVPFIAANDYASLEDLYSNGVLQPDIVEFLPGVSIADVTVQRSTDGVSLDFYAGDHGMLQVQLARADDVPGSGIEWFSFADGSAYSLPYLLDLSDTTRAVIGTRESDTVRGSALDEVVLGLQGDDVLAGGAGNDVYFFGRGSGHDVVDQSDAGGGDVDTLRFSPGILQSDVLPSRSGSAIVLTIADTGDSIAFSGWFDAGSHRLARIEFSDGAVWTADDLESFLPNNAPIATGSILDQQVTAYATLSVSTAGLFVDPDEGDSLSYQASLADGSPLPSWLAFDAATQILSGTPSAQDVGALNITVTAIDGDGLIAAETFTVTVDAVPDPDPVIRGTAGDDSLVGTAGDDRLDGGAGSDTMAGGNGADVYVVDNTGDVIIEQAGGGIDRIESSVSYTLPDFVEQLILTGDAGINGTGNARRNTIVGNSGANVIDGGGGADTMVGGAGDDTFIVNSAADVVIEAVGAGNDSVLSSVTYALPDNVETLVLTGSSSIRATGNNLDNVVVGNDANNVLDGGAGADTLIGRKGNDTYIVDHVADIVLENAGEGKDLVRASVGYALPDNVENLTLTGGDAIVGVGNALGNVLTGNAAASLLVGGPGDDTYVVSDARNVIIEAANEGTDLVKSSVSYTLADNVENLTLTGTLCINGFGNGLDNVMRGNDAANLLDGFAGDDTLQGNLANDVLRGAEGNDVLRDNGGDNVLDGGAGNDNLSAKGGNDLFIGGTGDDVINTGNGADLIAFNRGDGQDKVAASTGADNVLSLGGGIRPSDLSLRKSGSSLVLQLGAGDQITFSSWYAAGIDNRSIGLLQLVAQDGTIQTFDFLALTAAFDAARASNSKLTSWELGDSTARQSAGAVPVSLPAAAVALWYARNSSLDGLDLSREQGNASDTATPTTDGGDGNDFLAGGAGDDTVSTGDGANVVAFNRGGGTDAVFSDASASNTLSLGGVRYDELSLEKSGNDLVLETGGNDNVVLKDWYAGKDDVRNLQLVLDSTSQYDASSADPLYNKKVETFDFLGMVARFDESREQNPGITSWSLTNALLDFHLSGADDAALGGDLAYAYAHNGSLQGISPQAAQQVIGTPGFGSEAQQLRQFGGLQEGLARIG